MLNITLQQQLTDLLASARSAIESMLIGPSSQAMVLVPAARERSIGSGMPIAMGAVGCQGITACAPGYPTITGANAHAAVRMHVNPVTNAWHNFGFGKTKTGDTGHSQPSRFAT